MHHARVFNSKLILCMYATYILYGGKVWQGEGLANLLFSNVWQKKTLANE